MAEEITYSWREAVADDELISLVESHGGTSSAGWCSRVSFEPRLGQCPEPGWAAGRIVNVACDGGGHGFLVDTTTRGKPPTPRDRS